MVAKNFILNLLNKQFIIAPIWWIIQGMWVRDNSDTHRQLFHHVNGGRHFGVQCLHKPKLIFHPPLLIVVTVYLVQIPNQLQDLELSKRQFGHHLRCDQVMVGLLVVEQFVSLSLWECGQFQRRHLWHVEMCL